MSCIEGNLNGNEFQTHMSGLHEDHQGHHVMSDVYHHLMEHHGLDLKSSGWQSEGGHKIWQHLAKKGNVEVHNLEPDDNPATHITARLKK